MMLPIAHMLIGLLFAYPLFKIGFLQNISESAIFVLSMVLIDLDHFIYFIFKGDFKMINEVFKAAFGLKSKLVGEHHYFLHFPELNILLFIAGFYYHVLMIIFVANTIHIICDHAWQYYLHKNFNLLKQRSLIAILNKK